MRVYDKVCFAMSCIVCFEHIRCYQRKITCSACASRCVSKQPAWYAHDHCMRSAGYKCCFCGCRVRPNDGHRFRMFACVLVLYWMYIMLQILPLPELRDDSAAVMACVKNVHCPARVFCESIFTMHDKTFTRYWNNTCFYYSKCVAETLQHIHRVMK